MSVSPQVVIDTNVWVSALRSKQGASRYLIGRVGTGVFEMNLSNALALEYEQTLKRQRQELGVTAEDIDELMRYVCRAAVQRHRLFFRWRGHSPDPDDDHILELAVRASVDSLITFNERDLAPARSFGIEVIPPRSFLESHPDV